MAVLRGASVRQRFKSSGPGQAYTLEEIASGVEKKLKVNKLVQAEACRVHESCGTCGADQVG